MFGPLLSASLVYVNAAAVEPSGGGGDGGCGCGCGGDGGCGDGGGAGAKAAHTPAAAYTRPTGGAAGHATTAQLPSVAV